MQLISTQGTTLSPSERRRYTRYAVRCRCWLENERTSVFAQTADVGLGGLFLRTAVPLQADERVRVTLELDDGELLIAEGIVSRGVRPGRGARHGVGVELQLVTQNQQRLERMLQAR